MLRVAALSLALVVAASIARADARKDCGQDQEPDLRLRTCAAIINGVHETKHNLAAAYNNRGIAYGEKGEYDRAIADYNRAIQLDPKLAFAYNNRGNAYNHKIRPSNCRLRQGYDPRSKICLALHWSRLVV
jgi:tetratricopeptide (TPR) repeat protein